MYTPGWRYSPAWPSSIKLAIVVNSDGRPCPCPYIKESEEKTNETHEKTELQKLRYRI